jgi:hypothetical protein
MCRRPAEIAGPALGLALWLATVGTSAQPAPDERVALDPFETVTTALPACPPRQPTLSTPADVRAQAHWRAERGTSCFQAGRCRLPNAYLYDREIIPRVKKAILADGRFTDRASLWVEGRRRWVWLMGCVRSADDSAALEALVGRLDDVEAVINELVVLPP